MKTLVYFLTLCCLTIGALSSNAQLYTGMSGLIKNPSADMNPEGEAVIAGYFMNKHFTPGSADDIYGFVYDGKKYNTFDFSVALTPFRWMEIGYTFTLQKALAEGHSKPKFNQKDRFFSVKFSPIREGKYYPAIAIGSNDFIGSAFRRKGEKGSGAGYFCNYYIVATKHLDSKGQDFGLSLGYRYAPRSFSKRWQGVFAGATWQPKWIPNFRLIGEWTGNEVNIGGYCLLWEHLFLQAALIEYRHFTGGIAFIVNLF